jgi:hypothetical protein
MHLSSANKQGPCDVQKGWELYQSPFFELNVANFYIFPLFIAPLAVLPSGIKIASYVCPSVCMEILSPDFD